MAQIAHVEIGDQPVDLADGLDPGCYIAQAADYGETVALYGSGATAPDAADMFVLGGREFFTFTAGGDAPPTWCRSAIAGTTVRLALALIPS